MVGGGMLTLRNYAGDEYAVLATKKIKSELNGTEDLSLTIHQQKNNALDLKTIDKLWEIHYENIDYKIIHIKRQTRGNSFYLDVRAKPLFYWDFEKQIIHENHDGSHTANSAFRIVFENSGYNFVLVDFSGSLSWEGFGKGVTRMEMFKRLIDRYGYEFEIQGKTVYMRHMIGNDTNYIYKYKLNASNVSENIDASGMFTHIKGFGDFGEGEEDYFTNAGLKRQYTSPLADIVTPPGKLPDEGKPIVDGRITNTATLDAAMKKAVDDSLQITVEGTLHDVRAMGYTVAVPKKGDRVWLHDERIDLEREIRLHTVTTTKDEKDNIIACDVTFGSQSIRERHKAAINTLSQRFQDLLTGVLKLPTISLEQIGQDMINAIHAASSEILFGDFGMQAISKTNPNHVFGVNSEGWYISQDGGATPKTIATAQGIYADALFAGTLWLTNELNIEGQTGYLNITGEQFVMRSKTNSNKYFKITPDGALANHGFLSVTRPDSFTDSSGKTWGLWMQDGIPQADMDIQRDLHLHPGATERTETRYVLHGQDIAEAGASYTVERFYTSHKAKTIIVGLGLALEGASSSNITVEVQEIGGAVVASTTKFIRSDEPTAWSNLTFDIGVPDFASNIAYYIKISSSILYPATRALVTVNRVSMKG